MKKLLLSGIVALLSGYVSAQSFMNGIGIIGMVQTAPNLSSFSGGGLTYNPRFNFLEMGTNSLSIGLPMSAVLSGTATYKTSYYYDNSSSLGAMVNLPLILNFNFGAGATRARGQHFGFFVGGGAGYHISTHEYTSDQGDVYQDDVSAFGAAANAGIRFGVGRRSKNFELRYSYMKVSDDYKSNVNGFAGIFNF